MARMLRRLSGDWHERWGHPLELAETFVDPRRHEGTMYVAGNWTYVGRSKGYARGRGGYTDPHGKPKKMFVYPLTSSSCARLCAEEADPDWEVKRTEVEATAETLPCLLDELRKVSDFRRGQGRKHKLGTVLAICVLARLAGKVGCDATSRYAAMMPQEHLEALEAWKDKSGEPRFHAPSRATIHRVMMNADSDELQAAATRWAAAHPATDRTALAVDGKRINGVNRTGAVYHETATIVTHDQGIPIASRVCNEEGGERAAALALLEDLNIAGATITMDALHTTRQTADRIVRTHRAHYLFSVKGNAPETFQTLQSIDWEQEATATFSETSEKEHGRVDRRHIACLSPLKRAINFPHVKQIFRVERHRYEIKTGKTSVEHAYRITSLPASERRRPGAPPATGSPRRPASPSVPPWNSLWGWMRASGAVPPFRTADVCSASVSLRCEAQSAASSALRPRIGKSLRRLWYVFIRHNTGADLPGRCRRRPYQRRFTFLIRV